MPKRGTWPGTVVVVALVAALSAACEVRVPARDDEPTHEPMQIQTLVEEPDPLQALVNQVGDVLGQIRHGRTNQLTLSFGPQPHSFNLSRLPVVLPKQNLEVTVDWSTNPDGWEEVRLYGFEDFRGDPVSTVPTELTLTAADPSGSIQVLPGRPLRPFIRYRLSYTRMVGGEAETWTIDPEWEHWP